MSIEIKEIRKDIDNLARMVAEGFSRTDAKFDMVFKELFRMNDRMDSIHHTLSPLVQSDALQDKEIEALDSRVAALETKSI